MSAAARSAIVASARRLAQLGLNPGRAGNVSARVAEGFVITPSALPYDAMGEDDLVLVDAEDRPHGRHAPSTEWRLHRDIYARRPEAGGVVHTHSPCATALACLRRGIPAFHYEVALAGGNDVRCAEYATFGSQELSDRAIEALAGRRACLLANHGLVSLAEDTRRAAELAEKVEALARMYLQALQAGEPVLLDEVEMARVAERFSRYGR